MSKSGKLAAILVFLGCWVSGSVVFSQQDPWDERVDALLETSEGDIVLTAVGDMIFNREISGHMEPAYQNLYRIIREADIGFGNLEMSLNEKPELQRSLYNFRRGREFGWEILKLGINLVGMANNHALDYGTDGLLDSMRILRQSGIAFAGAGRNLQEARAPVYRQVGRTRFALLSFLSAADWAKGDPDKPSINVLKPPACFWTVTTASTVEASRRRWLPTCALWKTPSQLPNEMPTSSWSPTTCTGFPIRGRTRSRIRCHPIRSWCSSGRSMPAPM